MKEVTTLSPETIEKAAIIARLRLIPLVFSRGSSVAIGLGRRAKDWSQAHRSFVRWLLRLALIVLLLFSFSKLMAPVSYRIAQGQLTYQLNFNWSGGRILVPLGPAGLITLKVCRAPVDLQTGFVLNKDLATGTTITQMAQGGISGFEPDAFHAFYDFLWTRIIWIVPIGLAFGALTSGRDGHRRVLRNALLGLAVLLIVAGSIGAVGYATLDRHPQAEYTGLAKYLPTVVAYAKTMQRTTSVQSFFNGIAVVSGQLTEDRGGVRTVEPTTRILAISDIHDVYAGLKRVAQMMTQQEITGVAAVIIAGDMTNYGTALEARLYAKEIKAIKVPIYMVGGNHEDAPAMAEFKRLGVKLIGQRVVEIDHLRILGFDDPYAYSPIIDPNPVDIKANSEALKVYWNGLTEKPRIIVVHELGQAEDLIAEAKAQHVNLTVIYGHDHKVGYAEDGSVHLVDCGTGGASGYNTIDHDPNSAYTWQVLDFEDTSDYRLLDTHICEMFGLGSKAKVDWSFIPAK